VGRAPGGEGKAAPATSGGGKKGVSREREEERRRDPSRLHPSALQHAGKEKGKERQTRGKNLYHRNPLEDAGSRRSTNSLNWAERKKNVSQIEERVSHCEGGGSRVRFQAGKSEFSRERGKKETGRKIEREKTHWRGKIAGKSCSV